MAVAAEKILGTFTHTQGTTWGGTQISLPVLKAVSLLGGFFGLDHMLLRSPRTAVLKLLVNIVSLGFWYFYDIVQLFSEPNEMVTGGLRLPIVGDVGFGAGILSGPSAETAAAPTTRPSPWRFLAYALLIWIPLGFSNIIAGDYMGGAAKFFLTLSPFFLFTFLWAIFSTFRTYFDTADLLTKGTDRLFPLSKVLGTYGIANGIMEPNAARAASQAGGSGLIGTVVSWAMTPLLARLGPFQQPALGAVTDAGKLGVSVLEGAKATVAQTATTVSSLTALPMVAAATAAATIPPLPVQAGGAVIDTVSSYLFLGLIAFTVLGVVGLTVSRWSGSATNETVLAPQTDEPPSR